ncbi:MAG: hypothetical protein PHV07_05140 [Oscillospiraceae bacterium]|nr:hypothetical protein [Oscillospiraceae bacterium]
MHIIRNNSNHVFLRVLTSFLVSLFSFMIVALLIINSTFLNAQFIINVFENHNFYVQMYNEYSQEVEYLADPAGVDSKIMSSVMTQEEMQQDIVNTVYSAYNYKGAAGFSIDKDEIENRFFDKLSNYAISLGYTVEGDISTNLQYVSKCAASTYETYAKFPYIDYLGNFSIQLKKAFGIGLVISMIIVFAMIISLYLTTEWKHRATRAIVHALSGSGLMLVIAPMAFLLSNKIKYIAITTKSIYDFAVGYVEEVLVMFIISGIGLLIASVLVFLFVYKRQHEKALH